VKVKALANDVPIKVSGTELGVVSSTKLKVWKGATVPTV